MRHAILMPLLFGAVQMGAVAPSVLLASPVPVPVPVKVVATPSEATLAAGAGTEIAVQISLEPGWHIYSLTQPAGGPTPTALSLEPCQALEPAGPVRQGRFEAQFEPLFGVNVESFSGTAEFWVPVRVLPTAKAGAYDCAVRVRYQACNGKVCLPPTDADARFGVTVGADHASGPAAPRVESAAVPAQAKASALDLRTVYDAIRAAQGERDVYSKLIAAVPEMLKDRVFVGESAYYAGLLWLRYDLQEDTEDHAGDAAGLLDAYLASPAASRFAESAEANLITALADLKRFDEAGKRFADLLDRFRWRSTPQEQFPDETNIEFAGSSLMRARSPADREPTTTE